MSTLKSLTKIFCQNFDENQDIVPLLEEIKETVFRLNSEEETKVWLNKHQSLLTEQQKIEPDNTKIDMVLYFLEIHYGNFLNDDLPNSKHGIVQLQNLQNQKYCTHIKQIFPEEFYNNIKHLLFDYQYYTIYQVKYLRQFWRDFSSDYQQPLTSNDQQDFENYLISQNFNTPQFFKYTINQIIDSCQQHDDPSIQKHILQGFLCEYNKIPTKIGGSYRKDYGNIKSLIIDWLQIEIRTRTKKQQEFNPNQQQILSKNQNKIEIKFTVAQLACIFKLLYSKNLINNKSQTEILEIISKIFKTPKAENISFESLQNKYYNIEDATKESVKELLTSLVKANV